MSKNFVFGAKNVVKTRIWKAHICQGHFQKSSFRLNRSTICGGSGSEKAENNYDFLNIFYVWMMMVFDGQF